MLQIEHSSAGPPPLCHCLQKFGTLPLSKRLEELSLWLPGDIRHTLDTELCAATLPLQAHNSATAVTQSAIGKNETMELEQYCTEQLLVVVSQNTVDEMTAETLESMKDAILHGLDFKGNNVLKFSLTDTHFGEKQAAALKDFAFGMKDAELFSWSGKEFALKSDDNGSSALLIVQLADGSGEFDFKKENNSAGLSTPKASNPSTSTLSSPPAFPEDGKSKVDDLFGKYKAKRSGKIFDDDQFDIDQSEVAGLPASNNDRRLSFGDDEFPMTQGEVRGLRSSGRRRRNRF